MNIFAEVTSSGRFIDPEELNNYFSIFPAKLVLTDNLRYIMLNSDCTLRGMEMFLNAVGFKIKLGSILCKDQQGLLGHKEELIAKASEKYKESIVYSPGNLIPFSAEKSDELITVYNKNLELIWKGKRTTSIQKRLDSMGLWSSPNMQLGTDQ